MGLKIFMAMSIMSLVVWMIYIIKNREESDKFMNFIMLSFFSIFTWIGVYVAFQSMLFLWILFTSYIIFSVLIFTDFKIFDNLTIWRKSSGINLSKTTTSGWDILVQHNTKISIENIKKLKIEWKKYYRIQFQIQIIFAFYSIMLIFLLYTIYFNNY